MLTKTVPSGSATTLRGQAEFRLKSDNPPPILREWATGVDALALLYKLASAPKTAGDALKLLHELQVHQVELALQHDELERSRAELTQELNRYIELHDAAPVGFVTTDLECRITTVNLTSTELFGIEKSALLGRRLDQLVAPNDASTLLDALAVLSGASPKASCEAEVAGSAGAARRVRVQAQLSTDERSYLIAFMETAD